jgi:hypothetical protein
MLETFSCDEVLSPGMRDNIWPGVKYRYEAQNVQIRTSTAKGANHDILNFVFIVLVNLDGGWIF